MARPPLAAIQGDAVVAVALPVAQHRHLKITIDRTKFVLYMSRTTLLRFTVPSDEEAHSIPQGVVLFLFQGGVGAGLRPRVA